MPFLRKDCAWPPACSVKGLRFAPINANPAPLTARAARRQPPLEGHLLFMHRSLRCLEGKNQNQKGVVSMQQISKSPLFPLGQVVATPGALVALEKAGQQPQDFLV